MQLKNLIVIFIFANILSGGITWKVREAIYSPIPLWNANAWAQTIARNHKKISDCYVLLIDNDTVQFQQACDITSLIIIEKTIIKEFANQHAKYPGFTRTEFLDIYYNHKNAVIISSHLDHQLQFNMTLMIMMIAEAVINSNNPRTNDESDFQRIPTRTDSGSAARTIPTTGNETS